MQQNYRDLNAYCYQGFAQINSTLDKLGINQKACW